MAQTAIDAEQRANAQAAREAEAMAERAQLDIAAAKHRGIDIGRRVIFRGGPDGNWLHATVARVGSDTEGRAMAELQVFGNLAPIRLGMARLHSVCGTCTECRQLSDGTSCAR